MPVAPPSVEYVPTTSAPAWTSSNVTVNCVPEGAWVPPVVVIAAVHVPCTFGVVPVTESASLLQPNEASSAAANAIKKTRLITSTSAVPEAKIGRHRRTASSEMYSEKMKPEAHDPPVEVIDARGLLCPLPVLKTRERFDALPPESRLDVVADDPMARLDMKVFCSREGHAYLDEREEPGGGWRMALRKSNVPARP